MSTSDKPRGVTKALATQEEFEAYCRSPAQGGKSDEHPRHLHPVAKLMQETFDREIAIKAGECQFFQLPLKGRVVCNVVAWSEKTGIEIQIQPKELPQHSVPALVERIQEFLSQHGRRTDDSS